MQKIVALIILCLMSAILRAEVIYTKYNGAVELDGFSCSNVISSFVNRLCFSEEESKVIALLNDTYYQYCGVGPDLFSSWLVANSKGGFFNRYIKGQYHC